MLAFRAGNWCTNFCTCAELKNTFFCEIDIKLCNSLYSINYTLSLILAMLFFLLLFNYLGHILHMVQSIKKMYKSCSTEIVHDKKHAICSFIKLWIARFCHWQELLRKSRSGWDTSHRLSWSSSTCQAAEHVVNIGVLYDPCILFASYRACKPRKCEIGPVSIQCLNKHGDCYKSP